VATFQPKLDHLDELREPVDDTLIAVAQSLTALDDGWTVYVRPQIGLDTADIVLVHEQRGVLVIQVGEDGSGIESARRHRSTIYDQFFSLPGDGRDPGGAVRAALVSPARETTELRSTLAPGDPAVAIWGGDVLEGRLELLLGATASPVPSESVRRLRRQIVSAGVVHEAVTPVQLSANARMVVANPKGVRIRGVTGPAGSGKTFALTARAARLAAEGRSVLVLCFNSTLANRLRQLVVERCAEYGANPTLVTCTNFHNFCARVVDDAARAGIVAAEPARGTWPVKIVAKTSDVLERGFERRFDAVLVDEGQDFTLEWWNLLRDRMLRPDGEMLLATDPSVDIYGKQTWSDPSVLAAAGFAEPWISMASSYRMAPELTDATNQFARAFVDEGTVPEVPADQVAVVGHVSTGVVSWRNLDRVADLGPAIGHEVVRLLSEHPDLSPRDIVYLCEYHHDGLAAAAVIEAAGFPVHHVYSRDPDERHRRKARFWPDADAVKGCTVHSFKGWESPAVVLGIGMEERSRRLAYGSMTRVSSTRGDDASYLAVLNADPRMAEFGRAFEQATSVTVDA
jgi:hypothetical protein